MTNQLEVTFDLETMDDESRRQMERELITTLTHYGWTWYAFGAGPFIRQKGETLHRDIMFFHCPNQECKHWGGYSGCDAGDGGRCKKKDK